MTMTAIAIIVVLVVTTIWNQFIYSPAEYMILMLVQNLASVGLLVGVIALYMEFHSSWPFIWKSTKSSVSRETSSKKRNSLSEEELSN